MGTKDKKTQFPQEIDIQTLDRRSCEADQSLSYGILHLFFKLGFLKLL